MASDLSSLIQESICSTLKGLLAKEATLKETTKAVEQDFLNKQLLRVDSSFEFDNITSNWSFFIPAYTSSLIFNTMLGDDSEPVNQIDSDIADAISEFVSNLSGSLTTAINGAGFEDLGQSKFNIGTNEVLDEIEDIDETYKFKIDLDGQEIELFNKFDDIILPFLSVLSQSPESAYAAAEEETEPEPEEEVVQEEQPPVEEEKDQQQEEKEAAFLGQESPSAPKEEPKEQKTSQEPEQNEEEDEEEEPLSDEEKKEKKLKMIIVGIAGLLVVTIITGIVMYFMGAFEPEPVVMNDTNNTKSVKKVGDIEIVEYKSPKKSNFDIEMIDINRLNARLEALTKYEILSEMEIEEQKIAEKERLYNLDKKQELEKFASKNKEEDIFIKNQSRTTQKIEKKSYLDEKLRFISVKSLKFKLYKQLISELNTHQARVSICKNETGRTAVYIGPFKDKTTQEKMMTLLENQNINEASPLDLSQLEFDSRCNFE